VRCRRRGTAKRHERDLRPRSDAEWNSPITRAGADVEKRVVLRVRGEADELPAKISKVKGVHDVEAKPDGSVEFEFSAGQDIRPQVAKAVIHAGYDLLEMRPIGLSLEEIFLELTRDNATGKKAS